MRGRRRDPGMDRWEAWDREEEARQVQEETDRRLRLREHGQGRHRVRCPGCPACRRRRTP